MGVSFTSLLDYYSITLVASNDNRKGNEGLHDQTVYCSHILPAGERVDPPDRSLYCEQFERVFARVRLGIHRVLRYPAHQ